MQDYNRRFSDNDACWLIKIETRVSGPYSFNEVLAKLTSGEIYSHHEVMQPLDRWRSLVAQPLFSAAVEKLKRQMELTPESTMTRTERTSITRTLDIHSDRSTPTPFANTITPPPRVAAHPLEAPQSNYESYRPPQKKKLSMLPFIIISTAVLLAAFVYHFLSQKREVSRENKQHSNFVTYVDKGLAAKKVGDWHEAIRNFKLAHQLDSKDIDLTFEVSPLLIQVEKQTMYARSLIDKIMVGQYKNENLSMGKNILGLSYSYENQFKQAIGLYKEALESDENYIPAQTNRGLALILSGRYKEAEQQLSQAVLSQGDSTVPSIYLLLNYIFEGQKTNDEVVYDKALQLANQLLSRRIYDGQQEVLLMQAYAAFKKSKNGSDTAAALSILEKSLSIDPDQTTEHLHSPLLDWRGLNWRYFSFICKDFAKVTKGDLLSLLEFTCTYKMNPETEAQQAVELLMNRQLNSPLPHVAQAIVAYRLGEYEKAKDSLKLAQKLGASDKLYLQVLMKVCSQLKDSSCIRQNMDKVSKVAPLHATLGKLYERAMGTEERNQTIQTGLRESRNYIPLLKLQ